ncbi:YtpR family tRNA-binding protein [Fundicoccus sp. Sow4_F4]|uniref:YtpR family tRNA-binding protein n=1 Tax=Fundicoccus sp. Sow4_F4 TaxID=3438783 RepID=UPI003F91EDD9
MWLAFYNQQAVGDVLMLTSGSISDDHVVTKSNGDVTLIKDRTNESVVALNLFNISKTLEIAGNGLVALSQEQADSVNGLIQAAGFDVTVAFDNSPKFVVGYVEECVAHQDSDHLSITQTRVSEDEVLQIVCGARNIAKGQHVLVAKPGAVMPSGAIIWAGALRGVESLGMICSTRELGLAYLEDLPGIWELRPQFEAGTSLKDVVAAY